MESTNFILEEVYAVATTATSTEHNLQVAWPYIIFSILLVISLIGVAHKLTRNQT